ncbi:MAG: hypothetical protein JRH11_17120, partial [Deltaproteobacteria bacterium]|nr:hypothetical protein [Deltaproteobacteria bacterium]
MRRVLVVMMVALAGFALGACGDDGPRPGDGSVTDGGDASLPPQPDADGDTISDNDEGRVTNRDTDGDDIPD